MKHFLQTVFLVAIILAFLPGNAIADEHAGASRSSFRVRVKKGAVPADQEYLRYIQWYEQQSTLTVVINGENRQELKRALDSTAALKARGVLLAEIILVETANADLLIPQENLHPPSPAEFERLAAKYTGGNKALAAEASRKFSAMMFVRNKEAETASALGAGTPSITGAGELVGKYDLRYSPAWIVHYRGKDFVFEGSVDPKRLFSADGQFYAPADFGFSESSRSSRPSSVRFPPRSEMKQAARYQFPLPAGAGTFDGKPDCEGAQVRRKPVLIFSDKLKLFDMVVYDYRDPIQAANADRWDLPAVPFLPGALANPIRPADPQQYWARFFDVRCLPTRVHYREANGIHYEEYREGARAFDREY